VPNVIGWNLAALAIAVLYYWWRDVLSRRQMPEKVLRERVAYMLWTAAQQAR
jgi:hypothetical protein